MVKIYFKIGIGNGSDFRGWKGLGANFPFKLQVRPSPRNTITSMQPGQECGETLFGFFHGGSYGS